MQVMPRQSMTPLLWHLHVSSTGDPSTGAGASEPAQAAGTPSLLGEDRQRSPSCPSAAADPGIPAATMALLGQPGASPTSPPSAPFIKFLQPSPLAHLGPLPAQTGMENMADCLQPTCPLCLGTAGSWLLTSIQPGVHPSFFSSMQATVD